MSRSESQNQSFEEDQSSRYFHSRDSDDFSYYVEDQFSIDITYSASHQDYNPSYEPSFDSEGRSHVTYEHSSDIQQRQSESIFSEENEVNGSFEENQQINQGLSTENIEKLPEITWELEFRHHNPDQKCLICFSEYELKQKLRVLHCLHRFHQPCIDQWLVENNSCPTCRSRILILDLQS